MRPPLRAMGQGRRAGSSRRPGFAPPPPPCRNTPSLRGRGAITPIPLRKGKGQEAFSPGERVREELRGPRVTRSVMHWGAPGRAGEGFR